MAPLSRTFSAILFAAIVHAASHANCEYLNPDIPVPRDLTTIRGQVLIRRAGAESPLPGALVRAASGKHLLQTTADRQGRFEFTGLFQGEWTISVDQPGFRVEGRIDVPVFVSHGKCVGRIYHVTRFGPMEQAEEAWDSVQSYAEALVDMTREWLR